VNQSYYYVCNVFEDSVKLQRSITTDSPAANGKVSRLCHAVRKAGGNVIIISLGRGRSIGTYRRFPAKVRRVGKVPIVYLDFLDVPGLTHLVTLISLCGMVLRLTDSGSVLVFYNCQIHYVLALIISRLLGRRCILDIEDGYRRDDHSIRSIPNSVLVKIFNRCCNGGAMLASSSLKEQTSATRTYVCYGVAEVLRPKRDWSVTPLQILLGGSLLKETGAALFLEALELLQTKYPAVLKRLRFVVTGFGELAGQLQKAAVGEKQGFLSFQGNVTSGEYRKILRESHIGLCLKLPFSSMGATTFPSKVVELASNGLLVVSTRVSDVPLIFDDTTAFLLDKTTPQGLVDALRNIADNPERASRIASNGQHKIASLLSEEKVGAELLRFWQGDV